MDSIRSWDERGQQTVLKMLHDPLRRPEAGHGLRPGRSRLGWWPERDPEDLSRWRARIRAVNARAAGRPRDRADGQGGTPASEASKRAIGSNEAGANQTSSTASAQHPMLDPGPDACMATAAGLPGKDRTILGRRKGGRRAGRCAT